MNNLIKVSETINAKETMCSTEIAELTGRRHDNIIRDIRGLLSQGVAVLNFEEGTYKVLITKIDLVTILQRRVV